MALGRFIEWEYLGNRVLEELLSYVNSCSFMLLTSETLGGRVGKCLGRDGELCVFISESIMFIFILA